MIDKNGSGEGLPLRNDSKRRRARTPRRPIPRDERGQPLDSHHLLPDTATTLPAPQPERSH